MSEPIDYKKRCEEYEKRMGIGYDDPAKEGYLVLVSILRQQNDYLKNINVKTLITDETKGKTAEFERAKSLWEKLPSIIENVSNLRVGLKMDGEEKRKEYRPISPKEIANGNV